MDDELAPPTDELILLAFGLPKPSGIELLLRLGECDMWRGDLGQMRADDPPSKPAETLPLPAAENTARAETLYEALFVRQAIDYLQPRCREILHMRYVERLEISSIAQHMETTDRYTDKLVGNCRKRIYEIVENLKTQIPLHSHPQPESDAFVASVRETGTHKGRG